jgi:DNA-binding transcriptional ArsR family regulator
MSKVGLWATPRRLAVGKALLDGPRRAYEVASAASKDPSNVAVCLKELADAGGIVVDDESGVALYSLAAGEEGNVLDAVAAHQPIGSLRAGQRLVSVAVPAGRLEAFAHALRSKAKTAGLLWVAQAEGTDTQFLMVFDREAPANETRVVVEMLQALEVNCRRALVEEITPAAEFRKQMSTVRDMRRSRGGRPARTS